MIAGFDPILAQAVGFDRSDLEHNRRGALSPAQIEAVRAEHSGMIGQSHFAARVMGVFYLGIAIACVLGAAHDGGSELALQVAGVFAGLGVLAVLANAAHYYRTGRGADLRLYVAEGVPRCREDDESFRIDVGGVEFYVSPAVYAALHDGQRYRIYYVDQPFVHSCRPVSAEVLL